VRLKKSAAVCGLKLCVVFAVACLAGCAETLAAESWAKKVCHVVDSLPEASASELPSGTKITIVVTPSSASAIVFGADGATRAYQAQMK
jgi:hypothetical protein